MPCIRRGNAIICSRNEPRKRCAYCQEWSTILCDFPIGNGKTCDRPTCRTHAKNVGPNRDYCEEHARAVSEK